MRLSLTRSCLCWLLCSALVAGVLDVRAALAASGQNLLEALHLPELEAGFHLLYELKPGEAHKQFEAWQKSHPQDPLGSASEAAAYLFEECYRQGVLTSEFFRLADTYSKKLLVVAPDAADAYLGLGTANYFIGSLPGIKKFFLGFAGIHGDKEAGIQQIEIAAAHGHYLRPFAKILLALAALREKKPEVARIQLNELVAEFPVNPLFVRELAKLKVPLEGRRK